MQLNFKSKRKEFTNWRQDSLKSTITCKGTLKFLTHGILKKLKLCVFVTAVSELQLLFKPKERVHYAIFRNLIILWFMHSACSHNRTRIGRRILNCEQFRSAILLI